MEPRHTKTFHYRMPLDDYRLWQSASARECAEKGITLRDLVGEILAEWARKKGEECKSQNQR